MFLKRYPPVSSRRTSYLVSDGQSRAAALIDPGAAIGRYMADAEAAGCRIRYVFFTNPEAIVTEGHRELRDRLGASIYVAPRCPEVPGGTAVRDGDVIELGNMRLTVMCGKGQLAAEVALLIYDLADSDRDPVALVAGETLLSRMPIQVNDEPVENPASISETFLANSGEASWATASTD